MSKGSKRRPEDKARLDANWDKIFGDKSNPNAAPGHVWTHNCGSDKLSVRGGQFCLLCGKGEDDV